MKIAGMCLMLALSGAVSACGQPGVVEIHKVQGSERAPVPDAGDPTSDGDAGDMLAQSNEGPTEDLEPCPDGWTCMDIGALGYEAKDADGNAVRASCSMGGIMPCDDADPGATCEGLSSPFCAHLMIGGQTIVSCAQRCAP